MPERKSFRAYTSVLYVDPRMKIYINYKKVRIMFFFKKIPPRERGKWWSSLTCFHIDPLAFTHSVGISIKFILFTTRLKCHVMLTYTKLWNVLRDNDAEFKDKD